MKLAPLFLRLTSLRKKERGHMKIASRGGAVCREITEFGLCWESSGQGAGLG